jgi:hypothetical protein
MILTTAEVQDPATVQTVPMFQGGLPYVPEPDIWWGEHGIDSGLGLCPAPYSYDTTTKTEA